MSMAMLFMNTAYQDCEYTQRMKNKAFDGDEATTNNKKLAVTMLKKGERNRRVEIKTGLSKKIVSGYKTKIKQGLM